MTRTTDPPGEMSLPEVADLDGILALRARIAHAVLQGGVAPEAAAVLPAAASALVAAFLAAGHRSVTGTLHRREEGGIRIRLEGTGQADPDGAVPTLPPELPGGVDVSREEHGDGWWIEAPNGGTTARMTGTEALLQAETALLRMAAGEGPAVAMAGVALRPLMEELRAAFAARAREAGVTLDVRTPPEEMTVGADRDRLLGVLADLVGNAFRFSRQGDRITVHSEPAEGGVTITVRDTGPGMAPAVLQDLFRWNWSPGAPAPTGSGPGFTLARRTLETMGGRMTAESTEGQGTAVHLTLQSF